MIKIGLTGGIGSGKSMAARIFEMIGVPVYDCDTRGKEMLGSNIDVIARVKTLLGDEAYIGNTLQRGYVASKVFSDRGLLAELNAIVHPVVRDDYRQWVEARAGAEYTIMESAILIESGFDTEVDKVIVITAPKDIRIARTIKRDRATPHEIRKRIEAQMSEEQKLQQADYVLYNDETQLLIPQILILDKELIALKW